MHAVGLPCPPQRTLELARRWPRHPSPTTYCLGAQCFLGWPSCPVMHLCDGRMDHVVALTAFVSLLSQPLRPRKQTPVHMLL